MFECLLQTVPSHYNNSFTAIIIVSGLRIPVVMTAILIMTPSEGIITKIHFFNNFNVQSKDLVNATIDRIIEAFAELPCKILWKYESNKLNN